MEVTRFALNGGEQSLYIALRVDLEAHMRGCRSVLNMELLQTGGAKRRRGMRHVAHLDKIPLGMSSATLSDGVNVLLLVYDDAVEIRARMGLWFLAEPMMHAEAPRAFILSMMRFTCSTNG